jgi:phosphoribosylanthranilate isomerase
MIGIKICGINTAAAMDAAVAAGADWVGFNFFPPSPRYVSARAAASLAERHPDGPKRVGLFVNPTDELIAETLAGVRLDALQVYVDAPRAAQIAARFGMPVWRPVGVASVADLPTAMDGADLLLIEAKPPEGSDRPGGNAATFDWTLLRGWAAPGPWMLAGGLTPGNVAAAIRTSGATAVDVASGVERAKGIKDPALVAAFAAAARTASHDPTCN